MPGIIPPPDPKRPLVPDTKIVRIVAAILAGLSTVTIGWAVNTLSENRKLGIEILEDIKFIHSNQEDLETSLRSVNARVDRVEEMMINALIVSRVPIEHTPKYELGPETETE